MTTTLETIEHSMKEVVSRFSLAVKTRESDRHYSEVRYANSTTGLIVALDWSKLRPFVYVCQLDRGEFPPDEPIRLDAQLKKFDLDDLLNYRSAQPTPVGKMFAPKSGAAAEKLLSQYAIAISEYAADVMVGGFDVFASLTRIVQARARNMRADPTGIHRREWFSLRPKSTNKRPSCFSQFGRLCTSSKSSADDEQQQPGGIVILPCCCLSCTFCSTHFAFFRARRRRALRHQRRRNN